MIADCVVSGAKSGAVSNLYKSYVSLVSGSLQVNEGPTRETFAGLPGVHFDVVEKTSGDGGVPVLVHEDAHVASDRSSKFVYATKSKDIQATGNSALLKRLDVKILVSPVPGRKNTFSFKLSNSLEVEKPWYAPAGIFVSEVAKSSIKSFDKMRDQLLPDILKRMKAEKRFASND